MKKLLIATLMLCPLVAQAAPEPMQGKYRWSLGFDVKAQWAAANGTNWVNILNEYKTGATIYLAYRFTNIWSFEFGYSWTDRAPKSYTVATGQQSFGATAQNTIEHTGKIRFKDTYLDFYAHLPVARYVEIMGGLGVGFVREGLEFNHNPNITSDPVTVALNQIQGRTEVTARINVGFQALWTERVGVRFLFSYETLNNIRMRNVNTQFVDPHLVNNAYTVALGLYWNFTGKD